MNTLVLGGSNAGLRDGWAAQFAERACADAVENRFLGAVGSLYGLMALLKLESEGARLPDLVVFEYCLNDILLVDAGALTEPLIVDALEAVADFCARARIALLFLCLEPRPAESGATTTARRRVQRLYAATAKRRNIRCLWLREIFAGRLASTDYQDDNHLAPEAARRVCDALLAAIAAGVGAPGELAEEAPRFHYVDATRATTHGPCRLRHLSSPVFDGPFIEIARGGSSVWEGHGLLAGLMLRSNENSGVYSIAAGRAAFRKNARSQMQQLVKNLMLLHYPTRAIRVRDKVEIAMPDDAAKLENLPEDRTLLPAPAVVPFEAQTLDIHGVMFWRPRALLSRLLDFRKFLPRSGRRLGALSTACYFLQLGVGAIVSSAMSPFRTKSP